MGRLRARCGRVARSAALGLALVPAALLPPVLTGTSAGADQLPVTFVVDTTADAIDIDPGDRVCTTEAGTCSLRAAIEEANATPTADTIVLANETYTLTLQTAGDLEITQPVELRGNGATIDASALGDRAIHVAAPTNVTLRELTVTGGAAAGDGGGVLATGSLVALDVTLVANAAAGAGGGLAFSGPALAAENLTVSANTVSSAGASGVSAGGGSVELVSATIADNVGNGGPGLSVTATSGSIHNAVLTGSLGPGGPVPDCSITPLVRVTTTFVADPAGCGVPAGGGGNLLGGDAGLEPLAELGPVPTHRPAPGSRLLEAGSCPPPVVDARGAPRSVPTCDLGAHEVKLPGPPLNVTVTPGSGRATVGWSPGQVLDGPVTSSTVTAVLADEVLGPAVDGTCTTSGTSCVVTGLTNGVTYRFEVRARTVYGVGAPGVSAPVTVQADYLPLVPVRVLDTRTGTGAPAGPLGPGSQIDLLVAGRGGVPATGVEAVVLNVTSTGATAPSFVTVWPTGVPRPGASNLNTEPGQDTPNLVIVAVGDAGRVSLYNHAGQGHLVADVQGWFPASSTFVPLTPARLLDTRAGNGAVQEPLEARDEIEVLVAGRGGLPPDGVGAVVMNVTSTGATAPSFVTVWPSGVARPTASNLNTEPGQDTPNLALTKVGSDGRVRLYNHSGQVDLVGDVAGWFPTDSGLTAVSPVRLLDTRTGTGAPAGPLGPQGRLGLQVTGRGGVPTDGVGAVVLNVTSTGATAPSFVTVWPTGGPRPTASNLNTEPGQDTPNLVVVQVGDGGRVDLYNHAGQGHLVADLVGWFSR